MEAESAHLKVLSVTLMCHITCDLSHYRVTSVSTCLANAKTTCTNFKGGADNELIAEMYIHIHKVMCQQNVQEGEIADS